MPADDAQDLGYSDVDDPFAGIVDDPYDTANGPLWLLADALTDGDIAARREAVDELGRVLQDEPDERMVPVLLAALHDPDAYVRRVAIAGLRCFGYERFVEALIAVAQHDDAASVRAAAIRGLSTLDDARAIDQFVAALRDPDIAVRGAAVMALR